MVWQMHRRTNKNNDKLATQKLRKLELSFEEYRNVLLENKNMFMHNGQHGHLLWKVYGIAIVWGKDIDESVYYTLYEKCHPLIGVGKGKNIMFVFNLEPGRSTLSGRSKSLEVLRNGDFLVMYSRDRICCPPDEASSCYHNHKLRLSELWTVNELAMFWNAPHDPRKCAKKLDSHQMYGRLDSCKNNGMNFASIPRFRGSVIHEKLNAKEYALRWKNSQLLVHAQRSMGKVGGTDERLDDFLKKTYGAFREFLITRPSERPLHEMTFYMNDSVGLVSSDGCRYFNLSEKAASYDIVCPEHSSIFNISNTSVTEVPLLGMLDDSYQFDIESAAYCVDKREDGEEDRFLVTPLEVWSFSECRNKDNETTYKISDTLVLRNTYCAEKTFGDCGNGHNMQVLNLCRQRIAPKTKGVTIDNTALSPRLCKTEIGISKLSHIAANYMLFGMSPESSNWHFYNKFNSPLPLHHSRKEERYMISHVWVTDGNENKYWKELVGNFTSPAKRALQRGFCSLRDVLRDPEGLSNQCGDDVNGDVDDALVMDGEERNSINARVNMLQCFNGAGHLFSNLVTDMRFNTPCEDSQTRDISDVLKRVAVHSVSFKASHCFLLDVKLMFSRTWSFLLQPTEKECNKSHNDSKFQNLKYFSKLSMGYWIDFNSAFKYDVLPGFSYELTPSKLFMRMPVSRYTSVATGESLCYDELHFNVGVNNGDSDPVYEYGGPKAETSDVVLDSFELRNMLVGPPKLLFDSGVLRVVWLDLVHQLDWGIDYYFVVDIVLCGEDRDDRNARYDGRKNRQKGGTVLFESLLVVLSKRLNHFCEGSPEGINESLQMEAMKVTVDALKEPCMAHPLIFFDILQCALGWSRHKPKICYWPNVPTYFAEFLMRDYITTNTFGLSRLLLCIHTRAHLERRVVKLSSAGDDGKRNEMLCEIMVEAKYLIYLVKLHHHHHSSTTSIYPRSFGIYELYNSKHFGKCPTSAHPHPRVRSLPHFEQNVLSHAQVCMTYHC